MWWSDGADGWVDGAVVVMDLGYDPLVSVQRGLQGPDLKFGTLDLLWVVVGLGLTYATGSRRRGSQICDWRTPGVPFDLRLWSSDLCFRSIGEGCAAGNVDSWIWGS